MALPLALMAAGTVTQMGGQLAANIEQAIAEQQNAAFFRIQTQYARESAERAERLAGFDYAFKIGQQVGNFAASGVDAGSGSASMTVGGSIANYMSELAAIRRKGDIDVKLASMRGTQASNTADTLNSGSYNLLQAGTTLIKNYTRSEGYGSLNDGRSGITDKYPGYGNYSGSSYRDTSGDT